MGIPCFKYKSFAPGLMGIQAGRDDSSRNFCFNVCSGILNYLIGMCNKFPEFRAYEITGSIDHVE